MGYHERFEGLGEESSGSDDNSERYIPAIQAPLTPEQFEYYWNEELVVAYHALKDLCDGGGWALFERLDFCDFCKFAYAKSSKTKPSC